MIFFTPTYFTERVTDINLNLLSELNAKCIILDIDDTLVPHGHPMPGEEIFAWVNELKENNIEIMLVSNNFRKRVKAFATKLNLPYVYMGLKPLAYGIKKALKISKIPRENVLVIGDQIFTDILGANFVKVKSILVNPLGGQSRTFLLKFKRFFEKSLRNKIKNDINLSLPNFKNNISGGETL